MQASLACFSTWDSPAEESLERARLSRDGKAAAVGAPSPADALKRLVESGRCIDALRLAAWTLPWREALWWHSLCLWHIAESKEPSAVERDVFATVVRWIIDPSRPLAEPLANEENDLTSMSLIEPLAKAALFASQALHNPRLNALRKAQNEGYARNEIIRGVIAASFQAGDVEAQAHAQRQFVAMGFEVALGEICWRQDSDGEVE